MAPPSEQLTFNGDTDARKFFYVYENVVQKDASPVEKAERVVQHLTEKAFDFYYDKFVRDDSPTPESKDYAAC